MIYINRQLGAALPDLIDATKKYIDLTIYCMSPLTATTQPRHRRLIDALINARKRGLFCRAIIAKLHRDSPGQKANDMSVAMLRNAGWYVRTSRGCPTMHAKISIFDNSLALIGSHNWTDAALWINHEATMSTCDAIDLQKLRVLYDTLWAATNESNP